MVNKTSGPSREIAVVHVCDPSILDQYKLEVKQAGLRKIQRIYF